MLRSLAALLVTICLGSTAMAQDYWYEERGQRAGPVSAETLRGKIGSGALSPATLVWTTGMAGWQAASAVPALAAAPARDTGAYLRLKRATFMDMRGFEKPIPFATALIPADWTHEGIVDWSGIGCLGGPAISLTAASPDETKGLVLLPQFAWRERSPYDVMPGPCPQLVLTDAEQVGRYIAGNMPGFRVADVSRPPEAQTIARSATPPPGAGMGLFTVASDAATVRLEGKTDTGKPVDLNLMLLTQHMTPVAMGPTRGGQILLGLGLAVPRGADPEDYPEIFTVLQTLTPNPDWVRRATEIQRKNANMRAEANRNMAADTARTFANISKINADTSAAILQNQRDGYATRSAASDRMQSRSIDALTSTTTWQASDNTVNFPASWEGVWETDTGEFILSSDKAFDPNRLPGINATRLKQR